ncbi:MAG: PAS domain S-box protein [candidate division Zixibacteria bacterium]|nr:PAS domain S-box protein [candidate division Zixibacteria bacterium]
METIKGKIGHTVDLAVDSLQTSKNGGQNQNDFVYINLISAIPIPMVIIRKADSEILLANNCFKDIFGANGDILIGRKMSGFYYNPTDYDNMLNSFFRNGRLRDYEIICKRDDGTPIPMFVNIESIRFSEEDSLLCAFYDLQIGDGLFRRISGFEELYTSVVNNINIGVALISPKMEILALNKQMKEWYPHLNVGMRPICYKSFNTPPRESICEYCPTAKTLTDGLVHESITETPTENGVRNYRVVASPIKDSSGNVIFAIEMVEDVTERIGFEKNLKNSENKIRALLDQTFQFIALLLPNGTLIDVNESALAFSGIKKSDVAGRPFWEGPWWTHSVELQEKLKNAINDAAKGQFIRFEVAHPDKNGALHYVDFSLKPVMDDDGRVIYLIPEGRDITENKIAEKALVNSQQMLQLALNSIPDGVYWKDSALRYLGCNKKAAKDAGLTDPDMIVGKTDYDLSWRSLAEKFRADDLQVINEGISKINHEERIIGPNGSEIWLRVNKVPMRDQNNKIIGLLGAYEDITDRKKAEQALLESESQLRAITTSAQDAIIMINSDGLISFWNQSAERILGYSKEEAIGKNLHSLIAPPRYRNNHESAFKSFILTGQGAAVGKTLDLEAIRKDGKEISVQLSLSSILLSDGWHGVGILRDVTERKISDIKLKESQEILTNIVNKYTAMINTVPARMYIKGSDHKYSIVNEAFAKFAGLSIEQVTGKTDFELFPQDKAMTFYTIDKNAMENDNTIINQEEQVQDKDGVTRWYSTTKVPLHDKSGAVIGLVGLTQDITEQYKSRQQLVQSDKLAAIGTLAAGVAHEINNPIGYINSNLSTMKKYLVKISQYIESGRIQGDNEKIKEILKDFGDAINESIEGSDRVRKIVADLKSFSRVDQAEKVYANINEGIKSTLNIVWNELKYKCKVEHDYGELPDLYCMPNQLNQVFMNILVNAGQAITGDNGLIKIKTWSDNNNIYVSIADNGCGIPEENINKIFEAFYTTKEVGKGTGLGLSLSYDIINKHNGKIDVKSQVGVGTEFIITLPVEGSYE